MVIVRKLVVMLRENKVVGMGKLHDGLKGNVGTEITNPEVMQNFVPWVLATKKIEE